MDSRVSRETEHRYLSYLSDDGTREAVGPLTNPEAQGLLAKCARPEALLLRRAVVDDVVGIWATRVDRPNPHGAGRLYWIEGPYTYDQLRIKGLENSPLFIETS